MHKRDIFQTASLSKKWTICLLLTAIGICCLGCASPGSIAAIQPTLTLTGQSPPPTSTLPPPTHTPQPSATFSPSPTSTPVPTFTPTATPVPLGHLAPLSDTVILDTARGLTVIERVTVTSEELPAGLKIAQLPTGGQVVTIAQDAMGHKVFIYGGYPASIRQVASEDGLIVAELNEQDQLVRYVQPGSGFPLYYMPVFSLEIYRNATSDPITLNEDDWIIGVPLLVLDSSDEQWYFWWRDASAGEHRHRAVFTADDQKSTLVSLVPQFGLLSIYNQTTFTDSSRKLWEIGNDAITGMRPPSGVNSIIPIRNLFTGGSNPEGYLGVMETHDWTVSEDIAFRLAELAVAISRAPYEENGDIFFDVALPTASGGGTELKVLLLPDGSDRVGYCKYPDWSYSGNQHCVAADQSNIKSDLIPHLQAGDTVWFSVLIGFELVVPMEGSYEITDENIADICENRDTPNCMTRLPFLAQSAIANYPIVQRIAEGEDLDGLVLAPVNQLWIGGFEE